MAPLEFLDRQPRWFVFLEASAAAVCIGWIDYVTGWEWSFFVLYAVPIIPIVRRFGQPLGILFAGLSALIWWIAQLSGNPYHSKWGFAIAVFSRFFYFAIVVIAAAAVEARREVDLARIASLERAQELEREILRTSEQEQQRIGRDLHDSLGPHLAAIGYAVTFLENELRRRGQPEVATTGKIQEMVKEALALTRSMARGIHPAEMDGSGLAMALDEMASTISNLTGVAVSFWETGNTCVDDSEAAMHLFRIAQEAVNNATKHGRAKNVSISLITSDGSTRLVIADDGIGIPKSAIFTRGIGLQSMKYRARAVHGNLKIDSTPNEGTVVVCEMPAPASAPAAA
jgi:signal transduction histidine kinase